MVDGFDPAALGVEGKRKVELRLMIERVFGDPLFEIGDRSKGCGLFGDLERGARRRHGGLIVLAEGRNHGERLLGLFERAGLDIAAGETGKRVNVRGILREHAKEHLRRAGGVAFDQTRIGRLQKIELLAAELAPNGTVR